MKINSLIKNAALVLSFCLILTACSSSKTENFQQQTVTMAPTNSLDTGLTVHLGQWAPNANEVKASVLTNQPQAKIRVINEVHGIYEVHNLKKDVILKSFPQARIEKNQFFKLQTSRSENPIKVLPHKVQDLNLTTPKLLAYINRILNDIHSSQTSHKDKIPLSCQPTRGQSIKANITVTQTEDDINNNVLEVGKSFTLSNKTSVAPDLANTKQLWVTLPPRGSNLSPSISLDAHLSYRPDSLGFFNILLILQNEEGHCSAQSHPLLVTANDPYIKPTLPAETIEKSIDLKHFKHLAELESEKSWTLSEGKDVVIAIIDSGVNYNHLALAHNILLNDKEIPNNNIDDDNNGFIDDHIGFDFTNTDGFPFDDSGHGSHVAGLAASVIFGTAKKAKILSIKAISMGGGDLASIASAIIYAADRGAKVINMSFGGPVTSNLITYAINYAEDKGAIILAAAGNGDPLGRPINIDINQQYPASLKNTSIITVAAKTTQNLLAPYSNFGPISVDVVAPGGGPGDLISSVFHKNAKRIQFIGMTGTSMATPIVSGIVAQIIAVRPDISATEIKEILLASGEKVNGLDQGVKSGRYLNAYQAVSMAIANGTNFVTSQ